jgi:spore maturation protein CgeB
MRILYVAIKHDYGRPEQGLSFEHNTFFNTFMNSGFDIIYFDPFALMKEIGRENMNRRLAEIVAAEKPDCLFCVLFGDELDERTMRKISEKTDTVTINWFCDDHWRFDIYSRFWAPCFNWSITTCQNALAKYARTGYSNVIKSQWACNHFLYRKLPIPFQYDVTFVGKIHSNRPSLVRTLRDAGIQAHAWGSGWESGRLTQDEMIGVFNQSRINLNFSNARVPILSWRKILKLNSRRRILHLFDRVPYGKIIKHAGKKFLRNAQSVFTSRSTFAGKAISHEYCEGDKNATYSAQIKGRIFEIPGCGGLLLTEYADNLENYYKLGKEVVCFSGDKDLIEKISHYLAHDEERRKIAEAGYVRTLHEHTYVHRFAEIFKKAGLMYNWDKDLFNGKARQGTVREILK